MQRFVLLFAVSALIGSAQTKKIVALGFQGEELRELQAVTDKAKVVGVNRDNVMQEIADADGLIGDPTPQQVRAGKKLRWVQIRSAGAERVLHLSGGSDLRDSQIVLTNNQIVQGPEIGNQDLAMLVTLTPQIPRYVWKEIWRVSVSNIAEHDRRSRDRKSTSLNYN